MTGWGSGYGASEHPASIPLILSKGSESVVLWALLPEPELRSLSQGPIRAGVASDAPTSDGRVHGA